MVLQSLLKKSVPVGLIPSIKDMIDLAAELSTELYQNDDTDFYGAYSSDIPEDCTKVNLVLTYEIDDELADSFDTYLDSNIENLVQKYCELNKSWRLSYDECE